MYNRAFHFRLAAVAGNPLRYDSGRLDYTSSLYKTTLTLLADWSRPPEVDGKAVDYAPARVYDSPFVRSDFGSGVVTIRFRGRELVLDFNAPPVSK